MHRLELLRVLMREDLAARRAVSLYRLVQDWKLPAFRVGNCWRFRREDLEQWLSQQSCGMVTSREDD